MAISKNQRAADKEIAEIVNKLEVFQLECLTDIKNKGVTKLVDKLYSISKEHADRVKTHLIDIKDCLNGMVHWYHNYSKPVPYNTMYFLLLSENER